MSPGTSARHRHRRAEQKRGALAVLVPAADNGMSSRRATSSACSSAAAATSTRNSPRSACPTRLGSIQRLEEPGRPDLKQSNRGPGTGLRTAIPVLNIHKTRLNDPFMWFMGTNDQPGDYRHSGCAACHVVYANDREPRHSLGYAQYGRDGQTQTVDPDDQAAKTEKRPRRAQGAGPQDDGHGDKSHDDTDKGDERERGHPLRMSSPAPSRPRSA